MPYVRPTLQQLINQAQSDIAAHLPGSDILLANCVELVLGRATAGLTHGLHGHAIWLSRQLIPSAVMDPVWLAQWAAIYGLTPKRAVGADLQFTITGTNGSTCPAGTLWTTNNGVQYSQDALGTISTGTASISAKAVVPAAASNQSNGVLLSLVQPVAGINSTGTVTATNSAGADPETTSALLGRLLSRLQTPPKGGGPGDYVGWVLNNFSAATRAWQIPRANGAGTVAVYFVEDGNYPITSIIPGSTDIASVQAIVNANCPVTAAATVYAPTANAFSPIIYLNPAAGGGSDTTANRIAVFNALASLLQTVAVPTGFTLYNSAIDEAISLAVNDANFTLSSPASDTVYAAPNMPVITVTQATAISNYPTGWFHT